MKRERSIDDILDEVDAVILQGVSGNRVSQGSGAVHRPMPSRTHRPSKLLWEKSVPVTSGWQSASPLPVAMKSPPAAVVLRAEFGLNRRGEEDTSDLCLFLARSIAADGAAMPSTFLELLDVLAASGLETTLGSLARHGLLHEFMALCLSSPLHGAASTCRLAYFRFLRLLVSFCFRYGSLPNPRDVLAAFLSGCSESGPTLARGSCSPSNSSSLGEKARGCELAEVPASPSPQPPARSTAIHWSLRRVERKAGSPVSNRTQEPPNRTNNPAPPRSHVQEPVLETEVQISARVGLLARQQDSNSTSSSGLQRESPKGEDAVASVPMACIDALTDAVLQHNSRHGARLIERSSDIPLLFCDLSGFETCQTLLQKNEVGPLPLAVLRLLEVVTCSESLRQAEATSICGACIAVVLWSVRPAVEALCSPTCRPPSAWTRPPQSQSGSDGSYWELRLNAALRVLVNVTGLTHSILCHTSDAPAALGLHRDPSSSAGAAELVLAHSLAWILLSTTMGGEVVSFALCCVVNIVRHEGSRRGSSFVRAVVGETEELLTRVALRMAELYVSEDSNSTESSVLSGYYALCLGSLSLCEVGGVSLRVRAMCAVVRAMEVAGLGRMARFDAARSKPMALIVAILQEFVLFQSTAGTLTKAALVSMNDIISAIVTENRLEVSA